MAAGHRIKRAAFMHTGISRSNLHYHFLARPPGDTDLFCETARCVWDETSSFTMNYKDTFIDQVRNLDKAASYCTHEYQTHGADTLVLAATHAALPALKVDPIHMKRRLTKRSAQNIRTKQQTRNSTVVTAVVAQASSTNIAGNTANY